MHGAQYLPNQPLRLNTTAGPLEDGDCLSSKEFLRRYESLPRPKKVELIEGIVHVGSRVSLRDHARSQELIWSCLQSYSGATPGTRTSAHPLVLLDRENIAQPAGALFILSEYGGRAQATEKGFWAGPPEFMFDIAVTRGAYNLREKLGAYRRNGVQEYFVWFTQEKRVDWFQLEKGAYILNQPDPNNVLRSRAFPGLNLNLSALLTAEAAALTNTLNSGLSKPEHSAFVGRLASRQRGAGH